MNRAAPQTIYVDMDDVLCQAARHFLAVVAREFGKQVGYEQLTNFDVGQACGLAPRERDELYRIVHRPEELLQMAPIDEAISVINQWKAHGFEIAVVTGRPPETREPSLEWLAKSGVSYSSFTVVDKYSRFATESTIAVGLDEFAARRFCFAVEDSLPMAQYLAGRMNVPVALIDCPWNRTAPAHARVSRYRDWNTLAAARPALTGAGGR